MQVEALAEAGANLEFVIARRSPDRPGEGVVFVTPLKGARLVRVAKEQGFEVSESLHGLRVEAPDKPGLGAKITRTLGEGAINLRGLSAAALGRKCIMHLAFDSDQDAKQASKLLKNMK